MSATEELANRLRWTAFDLLRSGRAVPVGELTAVLDVGPSTVEGAVAELAARGLLEREPDGAVVGVHGLTLLTTRHRLVLDGVALHTWCALDAIGIPAALDVDAEITTECGWCRRILRLRIHAGVAGEDAGAVLWLPTSPCANVRAEFCPLANLFCNTAHLAAWQRGSDATGEILTVEEAVALGRQWWCRLPIGCCDTGSSAGA